MRFRFFSGGGAEIGSTRVIKGIYGVRHGLHRYRANMIVANNNSQFVAANDNFVVESDVRKAA